MWKEEMPPECEKIAKQYDKAADDIRNISNNLRSAGSRIDQSWICPAKNVFNDGFNPMPRRLEEYADHLNHLASNVRNVRVKIWVPDAN